LAIDWLFYPFGDVMTLSKLEHLQAPPDDTDDPKRLQVGVAGDTVELVFTDIDIMQLNILSLPNARLLLTKKRKQRSL
jgi:hypothetical protein